MPLTIGAHPNETPLDCLGLVDYRRLKRSLTSSTRVINEKFNESARELQQNPCSPPKRNAFYCEELENLVINLLALFLFDFNGWC